MINSLYTVNSDVHEHNTRQKHRLHTNKGSTNQFNKCFSNTSARLWNALQKTIDVNVSTSKFKHMSKTYLLEFSIHIFIQNEIAILLCSYVEDHINICKMLIY